MKVFFTLFITLLLTSVVVSQDYLSADFHKNRREALRQKMPNNSVAVVFTNPQRNRSNDVDYVYHQDPDFYYLTGYKEPHGVLVVFSENQTDKDGNSCNEILYVQERNPKKEIWTGKRLGIEGAKQTLGFKKVYNGNVFLNSEIDFSKYDTVMFHDFKNDYRDSVKNKADLYNLIEAFKTQIGFNNHHESPIKKQIYSIIKTTEIENSANVAQKLGIVINKYPELKKDKLLTDYVNAETDGLRKELKSRIITIETEKKTSNLNIKLLSNFMAELREIKTKEELKLLTKAIRISAIGQQEIMKVMHPNMSEAEIQGVHEFVYKKYGSEYEGYPSIVGAGNNGCVLHYIENSKTKVENDLVLMDLGAEYHGYTADVTRTIPANGTFTKEQKLIYDLVYKAQEAGIKAAQVGNSFSSPDKAARRVITEGLIELGIAKTIGEAQQYFPHGASHYLGLDVHDAGTYGVFKPNVVITVEPGIYIPEGSNCDEKWWKIAVRIEDDILITENGPINLSAEAPRTTEAIEQLMKQPSALDGFELPKLD